MKEIIYEIIDDYTEDPTNDELQSITELAKEQLHWEQNVKQLEIDLDAAKEALRNIQEYLLPEAMAACGMSEFKLLNGNKITIKDDVYASIRKDFTASAVKWLDDNGLGGIVKDQVAVDFGRGEFDSVKDLLEFCKATGLNANEKLSVHPMTLKATVKEQMASGVEFPEEFFSIGPVRKAIIKTK
jgi:hypothetical protein